MSGLQSGRLKTNVIRAGLWSLAGYAAILILRLGSNLVLARFLTPEAFGEVGVAVTIVTTFALLSDFGIRQQIIRRQDTTQEFLDAAWTFQIIRSAILWVSALGVGVIWIFAQSRGLLGGATIFANPNAPYVYVIIAFTILIDGFQSTNLHLAYRAMNVRRIVLIEITSQILSLIVIAIWLMHDITVWALVGGSIASAATTAILSHLIDLTSRNRVRWSTNVVRELFEFGKWVSANSALQAGIVSVDKFFIGAVGSATSFGSYTIATLLFSAAEQALLRLINSVGLPVLSEVNRARRGEFYRIFYRAYWPVACLCYFASGFLFISAPVITSLLYDARYSDVGWMLSFLSLGFVATPAALSIQCFVAWGKIKVPTVIMSARLVFLIVGLVLGYMFADLLGAVAGAAVSRLAIVPLVWFFCSKNQLFDRRLELVLLSAIPAGYFCGTVAKWSLAMVR